MHWQFPGEEPIEDPFRDIPRGKGTWAGAILQRVKQLEEGPPAEWTALFDQIQEIRDLAEGDYPEIFELCDDFNEKSEGDEAFERLPALLREVRITAEKGTT